jgi:hypothetical protein
MKEKGIFFLLQKSKSYNLKIIIVLFDTPNLSLGIK